MLDLILLGGLIGLLLAVGFCFSLVWRCTTKLKEIEKDIHNVNDRLTKVLEHDAGVIELNSKVLEADKEMIDNHNKWHNEQVERFETFERMYDQRLERLETEVIKL